MSRTILDKQAELLSQDPIKVKALMISCETFKQELKDGYKPALLGFLHFLQSKGYCCQDIEDDKLISAYLNWRERR
jgi:hypothetical protein